MRQCPPRAEGRQVVSLGRFDGRTAGEWTSERLKTLINWRNDLIEARVKVREMQETIVKRTPRCKLERRSSAPR